MINHLLLVDVTTKNTTGKLAQVELDKAAITVNKNMIPDDQRSPFDPSGIRLGTPAITTRGMKEEEMKLVAQYIFDVIEKKRTPEEVKQDVLNLTKKFPIYKDL